MLLVNITIDDTAEPKFEVRALNTGEKYVHGEVDGVTFNFGGFDAANQAAVRRLAFALAAAADAMGEYPPTPAPGFARCPDCGNLAMNPNPSCSLCGTPANEHPAVL